MVGGGGGSLLWATLCLDICKVGMGRGGEKVKVLGRRKAATLGHRISGQHGEPVSVRFEITLVKRVQSAWLHEFL